VKMSLELPLEVEVTASDRNSGNEKRRMVTKNAEARKQSEKGDNYNGENRHPNKV